MLKRLFILPAVCAGLLLSIIGPVMAAKNQPVTPDDSMPALYAYLTQTKDWLNVSRPLTPDDLAGRVILVDFWTYCCINCIHVIPKLKKLEAEFGDKLTVIGVHSAKFTTEGDTDNIRQAIQKYGVEHPVINDADFRIWNAFGITAWPTLLLISPNGMVKEVYRGEGDLNTIRSDIDKMIMRAGSTLVTEKLPIALEKDKLPPSILRFPTKMDYDPTQNILAISDSGHQRVLIVDMNTRKIIHTVGSGVAGFRDGGFDNAQFSDPHGILIEGRTIFVADTGNHRLRRIDLNTKTVTTIAGTGARGSHRLMGERAGENTALASPWDLVFYPDNRTITFANAGTHQLWQYDRKTKSLSILAGNGTESIDDGHMPFNSLSQPSGLDVTDNALFFVDAETSALRRYDTDKGITTLVGTGLFDFGLKDGTRDNALMQHPLGLEAEGDTVYVADTYNHALRVYKDGRLRTLAKTGLREPNDVIKIDDHLYVSDTNNHRIMTFDTNGRAKGALELLPMEKPLMLAKRLPNPVDLGAVTLAPGATLSITLPSGWHINPDAPSYIAVFDHKGHAVTHLKTPDLEHEKDADLGLVADAVYKMQGVLYYCKDIAGSQCLIRGVTASITVTADGEKTITVKPPIPDNM